MDAKAIDWTAEIGPVCALCGRRGCYREITPYWRGVVELFPHREEQVPIARFWCGTKRRTFSMLPYQLAPYHQYSLVSLMLMWILVAARPSQQGLESAAFELAPNSRVLPHLVRVWGRATEVAQRRLCGALHAPELRLVDIARLGSARGPPEIAGELDKLAHRYSEATGTWLLGTPSQQRGRASFADTRI